MPSLLNGMECHASELKTEFLSATTLQIHQPTQPRYCGRIALPDIDFQEAYEVHVATTGLIISGWTKKDAKTPQVTVVEYHTQHTKKTPYQSSYKEDALELTGLSITTPSSLSSTPCPKIQDSPLSWVIRILEKDVHPLQMARQETVDDTAPTLVKRTSFREWTKLQRELIDVTDVPLTRGEERLLEDPKLGIWRSFRPSGLRNVWSYMT